MQLPVFKRQSKRTVNIFEMADSQTDNSLPSIQFSDMEVKPECIGRGAFGSVYQGLWMNNIVAVKKFEDRKTWKSYDEEIRQLSRLQHPNVVKLFATCEEQYAMYLIMEYADGGSVYDVLHVRHMKVRRWEKINWALQVAEGVAYLHEIQPKPIIHRDLKSENLLLFQGKKVAKLGDFGIARELSASMTNNRGTARCMAPEVMLDVYTVKCDVYSFGILLWEILTRERPFKDVLNEFKITDDVRKGIRPSLTHPLLAVVSPSLRNLIKSCWDGEMELRPTMREVIAMIKPSRRFLIPHAKINENTPGSIHGIYVVPIIDTPETRSVLSLILTQLCEVTTNTTEFIYNLGMLSDLTVNEVAEFECLQKLSPLEMNRCIYDFIFKKQALSPCIVALERSGNQHVVNIIALQLIKNLTEDAKDVDIYQDFVEDLILCIEEGVQQYIHLIQSLLATRQPLKDAQLLAYHNKAVQTLTDAFDVWYKGVLSISASSTTRGNFTPIQYDFVNNVLEIQHLVALAKAELEKEIKTQFDEMYRQENKIMTDGNIQPQDFNHIEDLIKAHTKCDTTARLLITNLDIGNSLDSDFLCDTKRRLHDLFEDLLNEVVYNLQLKDKRPVLAQVCTPHPPVQLPDKPPLPPRALTSLKEVQPTTHWTENRNVNEVPGSVFRKISKDTAMVFEIAYSLPDHSLPNIQLNSIELKRECIGRGSFGSVYQGIWMKKIVAVKIFESRMAIKSCEVEIRQLSRLHHPNIVKLLATCVQPNAVYLIMEYADGGSVDDVLHSPIMVKVKKSERINWALQVAQGLAYLHKIQPKPIIHRDVKSANILLFQEKNVAKLAGFEIARELSASMTNNMGTARCMAPEVILDVYTVKCDVYSFGILLWELLTRERPFKDVRNEFKIKDDVRNGIRPSLTHHSLAVVSPTLKNLMKSCWDGDMDLRPTMKKVIATISGRNGPVCSSFFGLFRSKCFVGTD